MCQTSVMMEKGGSAELLLENATSLEIIASSVKITTLFEGTREFADTAVSRIDFAGGKVYLHPIPTET